MRHRPPYLITSKQSTTDGDFFRKPIKPAPAAVCRLERILSCAGIVSSHMSYWCLYNIAIKGAKIETVLRILNHNWFHRASKALSMQVIGALLTYVALTILARNMETTHYGQLQYILSWVVLLGIFGGLGIPHVALRYIPQYQSEKRPDLLKGFIAFSYQAVFAASLVAAAVIYSIFALRGEDTGAWLWGGLLIPIAALLNLQVGFGRITGQIITAQFPVNVVRHLLLIGAVLALPALGFAISPSNVLSLLFVGLVCALMFQGTIILPGVWPKEEPHFNQIPHAWLKLSLVFMCVGAGTVLMEQADILVLGLLKDKTSVAHYFAANRTAALIGFIYFSFNAALVPVLSKLHHEQNEAKLQNLLKKASKGMIMTSFAALLIILLFHKTILGLFGKEYTQTLPELTILCLAQISMSFIGLSEGLLTMTGHQKTSVKIYAVAVLINLVCNFAMIPWLGTMGAALSTLLSKSVLCVMMIRAAKRARNT